MSVSSYDAIAEKILFDLELTFKKYPNIDEFYIIPTLEEDNKNSSPVIRGENTLGLESWIIAHIYPYAHRQIMQRNNYKTQNLCKLIPCLTGVALLNPEMPTVWNRRRELIISEKLNSENELRLTRMALSRKPKCSDALMHRRWIINEMLKDVEDKSNLLTEELKLSEMVANRYHSNYHAWCHRMWSLQHLLPDSPFRGGRKKPPKNSFLDSMCLEFPEMMTRFISRSEFSYLKNNDISRIFFEELENNFKWVSSHVSDHSGLHFRKFLILEILEFFKNCLTHSNKMEFQNELDQTCVNSGCNLISCMFSIGKVNLNEFLGTFEFSNHYKRAVDDYLISLGQELTLFDVSMLLVVTELKSNYSLCSLFLHHEALWCYRKFLIFFYKQLIDVLDYGRSSVENRLFLHLDINGVPCRKDFKYDRNAGDSEPIPKRSDLYGAFYCRLLREEEEIISKVSSQDERVKSLVKNYSHWLKQCYKRDETIS